MVNPTLKQIAQQLKQNTHLAHRLGLKFGDCKILLQSNSAVLIQSLKNYFQQWLYDGEDFTLRLSLIESATLNLDLPFHDWKREPGKRGRKDAYFDFDQARLVYKVRTGMLFLQSLGEKIAAGPCQANNNQIINFINSQHMNWLRQHQWQICHAAGVVYKQQAIAMAGFSGGGKSTFMLHLLAQPEMQFLSNDRLFIRKKQGSCLATGIAKQPRINPGTILHNPLLNNMLTDSRQAELLALPKQQLWDLEEKYDVDIESIYGPGRFAETAPLKALIILNWQHQALNPCTVTEIELSQRRDLLAAVMKSPGPFYQSLDGRFLNDDDELEEENYLYHLSAVKVFEVSGQVDFIALQDYFNQHII